MPQYVPVTKENHASKRWKRFTSYTFAAKETLLPLVAAELPKALTAFPIAFLKNNEAFFPAAMLGFGQGRNLFVAGNGQWVGACIPSALRGHPFKLARTEDNQLVLCIVQDSDLITDGPEGEPFFDESGNPGEPVKAVLDFLQKVEENQQMTARMCAVLTRHSLIKPWDMKLQTPDGERRIEGIYQIDEQALNQLPNEAFLELRQAGALLMAYCQMPSMQHLATLGKLADAHAQVAAQQHQVPALGIDIDDDMIRFT